jgi:hypothetical protein
MRYHSYKHKRDLVNLILEDTGQINSMEIENIIVSYDNFKVVTQ